MKSHVFVAESVRHPLRVMCFLSLGSRVLDLCLGNYLMPLTAHKVLIFLWSVLLRPPQGRRLRTATETV